jgi:CBS domain-containing protein/ribosome-associated translation inhibitor RaiA
MDIADIVSEAYVEFTPETPLSKLVGTFEDPAIKGVVVRGNGFEGVLTRRTLATSGHQPNEKLGSLARQVPRLTPEEDVRTVARLMIESDAPVLPVFDEEQDGEGNAPIGVVTVDGVLRAVRPFLEAATVTEAYTTDLLSFDPASTVGDALAVFREHRIAHLPVVESGAAVGVLSLYDVASLAIRPAERSRGGTGSGAGSISGPAIDGTGSTRGDSVDTGAGERARIRDLPVRDLMTAPVRTIQPDETLETAVEEMFAIEGSSLVVTAGRHPYGILTKTDALDALTWDAEGSRAVQLYGADLLEETTHEEIARTVERFEERDQGLTVLDARIDLHEHDETRRGTPLLLARVRLSTDRGLYVASGEGYGASRALEAAWDTLERRLRDRKTKERTESRLRKEVWEHRFGWLLET